MRGESHRCLGQYLVDRYMTHLPRRCTKAFLIGCVEPDINPVTYLKGSFRYQWLRGHNYRNARSFMRRISRRLERKDSLNLFDYYTLGKLIHYIADAFTYAHNERFPTDLEEHRAYEAVLQEHFLSVLLSDPQINPCTACSVMDAIYDFRQEYEHLDADIHADAHFALNACCCVLALLLVKPIL